MKTTGMIFNGEMVRALLAGAKTQTRRPLTEQSKKSGHGINVLALSPFGSPGNLIWVRETHALVPRTAYAHSEGVQQTLRPDDDYYAAIYREGFDRSHCGVRWRPSIHMHRWASRLILRITDVRVERLQEFTEADARAEGITTQKPDSDYWRFRDDFARHEYSGLWDSIYGNWVDNPWVWVYEFDVIHQNVDALMKKLNAAKFLSRLEVA